MKTIIPKQKRIEYLSYIKSSFHKISQREIARRLGIGKSTVNRWSKEIGLYFEKHTVNETFFDNLSEISTYVLGYIFADGCVTWNSNKGYYNLTITSSEKDVEHLERIRYLLECTKPLLYASKTKSYRLIVNNKEICKKLMSLGVVPRKSLIMQFPVVPKEFIRHFIRGVIDGDGNVRYVNRNRSPYFEITIASGSKLFLQKLSEIIDKEIKIAVDMRKIGQNTYNLQYSCSKGKELAKYIYTNATIFLERKYLPFKNNVLEVEKND